MTERNYRLEVRLSEEERTELKRKVKKSGLSISSFIRRAIKDTQIKETPSADVLHLISELRLVGINIDQLLKKSHSLGFIDMPELRRQIVNLEKVESKIVSAFSMGKD